MPALAPRQDPGSCRRCRQTSRRNHDGACDRSHGPGTGCPAGAARAGDELARLSDEVAQERRELRAERALTGSLGVMAATSDPTNGSVPGLSVASAGVAAGPSGTPPRQRPAHEPAGMPCVHAECGAQPGDGPGLRMRLQREPAQVTVAGLVGVPAHRAARRGQQIRSAVQGEHRRAARYRSGSRHASAPATASSCADSGQVGDSSSSSLMHGQDDRSRSQARHSKRTSSSLTRDIVASPLIADTGTVSGRGRGSGEPLRQAASLAIATGLVKN